MTRRKEAGQALIFGVLTLGLLLMGFAGLGIDMGYLRYEKRLQQSTADSAAIAGASDLPYGHAAVLAAAAAAATTNGFSDNTGAKNTPCGSSNPDGCVTVTVNNPPTSGPAAHQNSDYVEVYVAETHPTFFMRVLHITSQTVTARAVATTVGGGSASGCLYTLGNPSNGVEGVNINGAATLDAPSCGIVDNGNFNTKGNALTVHSDTFGIAGDWDKSGPGGTVTCAGSANCPTATNMAPAGDPLSGLVSAPAQPANSTSCPPPVVKKGKSTPVTCDVSASGTLQPGTFDSISVGSAAVTFSPGLYYINGANGLSFGANATVTGTGVTFYFTNGATVSATGTPDIQLSAPNSGTDAGMLFYQDPSDTSGPSLGGDSASFFQGTLYFPTANLTFFGNGSFNSGAQYTTVITGSLTLSGHPDVTLNSNYSGLPNGVSIIKNAVLVE